MYIINYYLLRLRYFILLVCCASASVNINILSQRILLLRHKRHLLIMHRNAFGAFEGFALVHTEVNRSAVAVSDSTLSVTSRVYT